MTRNILPSAACAILAAAPAASGRASAPSPDDLEQWKLREQETKAQIEKAEPWKTALQEAFDQEPDAVTAAIFLITYKHHGANSSQPSRLDAQARRFKVAWRRIRQECIQLKLKPLDLVEAIYRFTNSDWTPVSVASGPGRDRVATPKQLTAWAKATMEIGLKARKAGLDPAEVWLKQAESRAVAVPADLRKVGMDPPSPRY